MSRARVIDLDVERSRRKPVANLPRPRRPVERRTGRARRIDRYIDYFGGGSAPGCHLTTVGFSPVPARD